MRRLGGVIFGLFALAAAACGSSSGETGDGEGNHNGNGNNGADAGTLDGGDGTGGNAGSGSGSSGGNSGNETDGGDNAAGGGSGIKGCAATGTDAELASANFLFVIDKSGSMGKPAEGDTMGRTRWEVTREALGEALDVLEEQANVRAGITLFPSHDNILQCVIPESPDVGVEPLTSAHRQVLDDALDAVDPLGGTPLGGAMMYSYEFLREQIVDEQALSGNTFVVLFTDGKEECDQSAAQGLADGFTHLATEFDIRTFVIGAPGSDGFRELLSKVAFEGNTPSSDECDHETSDGDCHFDLTEEDDFSAALGDALTQITSDRSVRCDFELPKGEKIDPNKVNVTFTPSDTGEEEAVLRDRDAETCDEANGWQYSEDYTRVLLCGEICDRVIDDPEGEVKIVLGCKTQILQ